MFSAPSRIWTHDFFITSEAPGYATGYHSILGFTTASFLCIVTYGTGCYFENKRRDKKFGNADDNFDAEVDALDSTDKQKEAFFRYVWWCGQVLNLGSR